MLSKISQNIAEKSPENKIYAKDNTDCKVKRKLDLYYVITNVYTKFQANMSKDGKGESEKN